VKHKVNASLTRIVCCVVRDGERDDLVRRIDRFIVGVFVFVIDCIVVFGQRFILRNNFSNNVFISNDLIVSCRFGDDDVFGDDDDVFGVFIPAIHLIISFLLESFVLIVFGSIKSNVCPPGLVVFIVIIVERVFAENLNAEILAINGNCSFPFVGIASTTDKGGSALTSESGACFAPLSITGTCSASLGRTSACSP
ncbi:hypothetical protein DERP_003750, partial [Dermatophagoides pteronyssinus]